MVPKAEPLQLDPSLIGTLELDTFQVPYVHLENQPVVPAHLRAGETEYIYNRSYPVKGYSATMPAAVAELQAEGRQVLVAERNERYYLYVA